MYLFKAKTFQIIFLPERTMLSLQELEMFVYTVMCVMLFFITNER